MSVSNGRLTWMRPNIAVIFSPNDPLLFPDVSAVSVPGGAALGCLDDLPEDVYDQWASPPEDGYHFTTNLYVGKCELPTLLDGGAVFSLTWEATLVALLNSALSQGMTPENPEWPLAALYRSFLLNDNAPHVPPGLDIEMGIVPGVSTMIKLD